MGVIAMTVIRKILLTTDSLSWGISSRLYPNHNDFNLYLQGDGSFEN